MLLGVSEIGSVNRLEANRVRVWDNTYSTDQSFIQTVEYLLGRVDDEFYLAIFQIEVEKRYLPSLTRVGGHPVQIQ